MQVIPAIDLMNGKVARLSRGDPSQAKLYDHMGTPLEIASKWKAEGAERLHLIDLDAAFGKPDNLQIVAQISKATGLPIQVGGGIRSVEVATRLLNAGMSHVILGALAFQDPTAITQIQEKFSPEQVIVALDNKDNKVMVEGWQKDTRYTLKDALEKFAKLNVKTFLITSITQDGMLKGPDLETLRETCSYPDIEVIAAGGIAGLNDLITLKQIGVAGVVIGKALYEGKFKLREAIRIVKGN